MMNFLGYLNPLNWLKYLMTNTILAGQARTWLAALAGTLGLSAMQAQSWAEGTVAIGLILLSKIGSAVSKANSGAPVK